MHKTTRTRWQDILTEDMPPDILWSLKTPPTPSPNFVEFHLRGRVQRSGVKKEILTFEAIVDFGKGRMENGHIKSRGAALGRPGIGTRAMFNLAALAGKEFGFDELNFHLGRAMGAGHWAGCGFVADYPAGGSAFVEDNKLELRRLYQRLTQRYSMLASMSDAPIPEAVSNSLAVLKECKETGILLPGQDRLFWAIADDVESLPDGRPRGRAAMERLSYDGRLDMRDEESMARFRSMLMRCEKR